MTLKSRSDDLTLLQWATEFSKLNNALPNTVDIHKAGWPSIMLPARQVHKANKVAKELFGLKGYVYAPLSRTMWFNSDSDAVLLRLSI